MDIVATSTFHITAGQHARAAPCITKNARDFVDDSDIQWRGGGNQEQRAGNTRLGADVANKLSTRILVFGVNQDLESTIYILM